MFSPMASIQQMLLGEAMPEPRRSGFHLQIAYTATMQPASDLASSGMTTTSPGTPASTDRVADAKPSLPICHRNETVYTLYT